MAKIVKVIYNSDTLETTISVDGKPFDTSRINGKEIADWAYPFMIRKVRWDGFYDEMVEALGGEKEFNLIFDGSEEALAELKEAWEDAPVCIIEEGSNNSDVIIEYDSENLSTKITVNGQPFDTSRIDGKEIEDWVYPFIIRKVKWNGIFEELFAVVGSESFTIEFIGDEKWLDVLNEECPETVNITLKACENKEETVVEMTEQQVLLTKLCTALSNRRYYIQRIQEIEPQLKNAIVKHLASPLESCATKSSSPWSSWCYNLPEKFLDKYAKELKKLAETFRNEADDLYRQAKNCKGEKEAFDLYKKSADHENSDAQLETGIRYYNGTGTKRDYNKAFEYFKIAANNGNTEAKYYMGEMYYNGLGVTKGYGQAIKWYKSAAKNGSAIAMYKVGLSYFKVNDLKSAKEWLEKAIEAGSEDAKTMLKKITKPKSAQELYNEAKALDDKGKYHKSFDLYKQSADLGNTEAQLETGRNYYYGWGIEENYEKAFQYFKKAADNGNLDSMNMLGICYHDGKGVKKNFQQAISWYRKGADKGHANCQYNLALCYWDGEGTKQNKNLAFDLFQKSAKQGYSDANNKLGLIYHSGDGRKPDIKKAIEYFKAAAEAGLAVSMYNLGIVYSEENNIELAREWLEKALEAGYENAKEALENLDESTESDNYNDDDFAIVDDDEDDDEDDEDDDIISDMDLLYHSAMLINPNCLEKINDFFKKYSSAQIDDYETLGEFINEFDNLEIKKIDYEEDDDVPEDIVCDFLSTLTTGLKYDIDVVAQTLAWFCDDVLGKIVNRNEQDFQNVMLYLKSVHPKLKQLIGELKENFNASYDKIFEFFEETDRNSSEDNYIVLNALYYYVNWAVDETNRKLEEIGAQEKKASKTLTAGGAVAGGLLSMIPIVGIPLALGVGFVGGSAIGNNASDKYQKEFDKYSNRVNTFFYHFIAIYIMWIASDNFLMIIRSETEEKAGIDAIDFEDSDDFFDEI